MPAPTEPLLGELEPTVPMLGELEEKAPAGERRALPRYRCEDWPVVRLLARPALRLYRAVLRDISLGGVGLLADQPFERGTVLVTQLQATHAPLAYIVAVMVQHATAQGEGTWLLGCRLSQPLGEREMQALVDGSKLPH